MYPVYGLPTVGMHISKGHGTGMSSGSSGPPIPTNTSCATAIVLRDGVPSTITVPALAPAAKSNGDPVYTWLTNVSGGVATASDSSHTATVSSIAGSVSGTVRTTDLSVNYLNLSAIVLTGEFTFIAAIDFQNVGSMAVLGGSSGFPFLGIFSGDYYAIGNSGGSVNTPATVGLQILIISRDSSNNVYINEVSLGVIADTFTINAVGVGASQPCVSPVASVVLSDSYLPTASPAVYTAIKAALANQINNGTPLPAILKSPGYIPGAALIMSSGPFSDGVPQQFQPYQFWYRYTQQLAETDGVNLTFTNATLATAYSGSCGSLTEINSGPSPLEGTDLGTGQTIYFQLTGETPGLMIVQADELVIDSVTVNGVLAFVNGQPVEVN